MSILCTEDVEVITAAEELDALMRIELAAHQHSPWTREMMRQELANPVAGIWGIRDDLTGTLGAMIVFLDQCDEIQILDVAVHPDFRRRGWARRLVRAVTHGAHALARPFITLEVRASNDAAIALYCGCGFVTVGRRKGYYERPGEDALIMAYGAVEMTQD